MNKTVESIVIKTDGIEVLSLSEGVSNITQLNLDAEPDEINEIFIKNNINNVIIYPYDTNIMRALAENENQLKDYLATCRNAHYSNGKVNVPDTIPNIEYDLRGLKNAFLEISEENLRKDKQIKMYNKAKETMNTFSGTKGKVKLNMGVFDKGYFAVQALLQNKNNKVLALNPGITGEQRTNLREALYNPELTEKTNAVSRENQAAEISKDKEKEEEIVK